MDECDSINSKNCMLKDACSKLKRDIRELERENKILKSENIDVNKKTLVLHEDINKLKDTLSMKEEAFLADFIKLESESLELK